MINDIANCVLPACSGTWIFALVLQASLVAWTFRIEDTFWSAGFIRIAEVLGQTLAVTVFAYRVRSTRRWAAWVADRW